MAGNLSRRISPELYQSVIALSCDGVVALSRDSISRRGRNRAPLCSPLLPYHFALPSSLPRNLPRWRLEPYGLAALLEDAERRPMGWLLLSCHFRLSGRRHRYISLCSSLFRLLNYIPINNALPAYLPLFPPTLFTIPSTAPREDSPSPGSRQIVAFVISARSEIPAKGSLRHFAFSTKE